MSIRSTPLSILAIVLLGVALGGCEKGFLNKQPGQSIALSQVPAPVKATIEQQSAGGNVQDVKKHTKDGRTIYTASIAQNGTEQQVTVAEDGKLIGMSKKNDDDD